MLAFLDSLCGALIARNARLIRSLLTHPLARALPRSVHEEALSIIRGSRADFIAPLHAMRLYHQTAHLLGVSADPASRVHPLSASHGERRQMELPLESISTGP